MDELSKDSNRYIFFTCLDLLDIDVPVDLLLGLVDMTECRHHVVAGWTLVVLAVDSLIPALLVHLRRLSAYACTHTLAFIPNFRMTERLGLVKRRG